MKEGFNIASDRLCPPIIHATTSMRVNYGSPIGLPVGLGPEEAERSNDTDGESGNGVVFLPAGGQQVPLTFKVPPNYDIYASRLTLQLWEVVGQAPNRTLQFVPPDDLEANSVSCDVRLEFEDAGLQVGWQNRDIHWSNLSGDGRRRYPFPVPHCLRGGRPYKVFVRNNETQRNFAISLVFWGRKTRTQQPTGGWTSNDKQVYGYLMQQLRDQGGIKRGWLSPDTEDVFENVGLYTAQSLDTDDGQPALIAAGTFDAPATSTERIYSGASSIYMVAQLMGRQYLDEVGTEKLIVGNVRPVFVHPFDDRQQYWLTNVPVPHMALCGDGRQPHLLEVEWSWGYGALVNWNLLHMGPDALRINIDTEGWLRRFSDCELC